MASKRNQSGTERPAKEDSPGGTRSGFPPSTVDDGVEEEEEAPPGEGIEPGAGRFASGEGAGEGAEEDERGQAAQAAGQGVERRLFVVGRRRRWFHDGMRSYPIEGRGSNRTIRRRRGGPADAARPRSGRPFRMSAEAGPPAAATSAEAPGWRSHLRIMAGVTSRWN